MLLPYHKKPLSVLIIKSNRHLPYLVCHCCTVWGAPEWVEEVVIFLFRFLCYCSRCYLDTVYTNLVLWCWIWTHLLSYRCSRVLFWVYYLSEYTANYWEEKYALPPKTIRLCIMPFSLCVPRFVMSCCVPSMYCRGGWDRCWNEGGLRLSVFWLVLPQ